jgi:hypothetical protein
MYPPFYLFYLLPVMKLGNVMFDPKNGNSK